jgi:hypothetical protein
MSRLLSSFALCALTTGCNTLLGVDDVSLEPDAAPTPPCHVEPRFSLISSNPSTSTLSRTGSGAPSALFLLNNDAKRDSLGMLLYANMGGHGALEASGTYAITPADSKLETCGICLLVNTDYDSVAGTFLETFLAEPQGTLTITAATSTRLAGSIKRVKFRRVDISGGVTKEVADPCSVTVDDVVFDMTYSTTATAAGATETTRAAAAAAAAAAALTFR